MKDKKKLMIATSIILGVLVLTLGLTYAAFTYNRSGETSKLVLGDIWMKYTENNQLMLNDAMPTSIYNYTTYEVNPVMASQSVEENELYKCVNYLNSSGVQGGVGERFDNFCRGTGTFFGETFQGTLDIGDFPPEFLTYFEENNIIIADENETYTVNPIMASQTLNELTSCIMTHNNWGYEFDEGSNSESYCKGTGTIDGGITFQENLDEWIFWAKDESTIEEGFLNDGGQELLDTGVVLSRIENLPYFEFNISGKNTYEKEDILYDIVLTYGDNHDERTTRIRDDLLRFSLTKVEGESEISLFNNSSYEDLTNKKVWTETIPKNTTSEVNITYRLYMWIDENTVIGNVNQDYTLEEWNDVFASIKVNVNGHFVEKSNFVTAVKNKYGTDESLVAINTDGDLYDGTGEIREYRYSGLEVNNYVYFDTNEDGNKTDDEIWRIVGIFKDTVKDKEGNTVYDTDGNPTYEEKVKLVRNMAFDFDMPESYLIGGTNYAISPGFSGVAMWNSVGDNNWITAGLQYYLNTEKDESATANAGYLSFLTSDTKELISPTTYYLGNVYEDIGTVKNTYIQERGDVECSSNLEDDSYNNDCNVWDGNKATWDGLVGLMYPSDYGYSASSMYWETDMSSWGGAESDGVSASETSWMKEISERNEWFLSPSSEGPSNVFMWVSWDGAPASNYAANGYGFGVRPVIYLKSTAKVKDGFGTIEDPYIVLN